MDLKGRFGRISNLQHLPTLPHILLKLIRACHQDQVSIREISDIVGKDSALTVSILKLVNSAYYGMPGKVRSVSEAVAYLGPNVIKNIAISTSIYGVFHPIEENSILNLKLFWWHSLKCAALAKLISQKIGYVNPDEAFLSGLLHDIGKLVLCINFKEEYENLLRKYEDRADLLLAGEIRLTASHPEVGGWLLDQWKLRSLMVDSVLFHHEPLSRILDSLPLVQVVYVSNVLSTSPLHKGDIGWEVATEVFGFRRSDIDDLLSRAEKGVKEVAESLHIDIAILSEGDPAISEMDHRIQEELAGEVRDISLLAGNLQSLTEARVEDRVLVTIQQGLEILFGTTHVLFFIYDPQEDDLIARAIQEDQEALVTNGLTISMGMEKSLLVSSLREGKPKDSFSRSEDNGTTLADAQIIRLLGTQGILCLPMAARGENVGVIVLGLSQREFSHLSEQLQLLGPFTRHAAMALYGDRVKRKELETDRPDRVGGSSDLIREIVHEASNPLGIIKNYLGVLRVKLSERNIDHGEIRILSEEVDRVAEILRKLAGSKW